MSHQAPLLTRKQNYVWSHLIKRSSLNVLFFLFFVEIGQYWRTYSRNGKSRLFNERFKCYYSTRLPVLAEVKIYVIIIESNTMHKINVFISRLTSMNQWEHCYHICKWSRDISTCGFQIFFLRNNSSTFTVKNIQNILWDTDGYRI